MKLKSASGKVILFACIFLGLAYNAQSQYTLVGSAGSGGPDCFIITPDINSQTGAVWYNDVLSLSEDFDMTFQVYLGTKDFDGADGMVFILQPNPTALGIGGGGIGYMGIAPSIAVEYDTYTNDDPTFDHVAVQRNGDVNFSGSVAGPVQASASSENIEDGLWHSTQITWDASANTLQVYFDGDLRLTYTNDIVAGTFGGNPMVYWGFTGATGGFSNLQQFCVTDLIIGGGPADIPLSSWALGLGVFLIISAALLRFRKIM